MLAYIFGFVLFALGIGACVALHEAGHMLTAKAFGMKVRRYYIGFGPKVFSWRRGETEYGFKWVPLGGFCDIAGMTALDELAPDEHERSFLRFRTWKRVVVLAAGSVTQFILGFVILYLMAVSMGLPNLTDKPVISQVLPCAQTVTSFTQNKITYRPCGATDASPAKDAGVKEGDEIVSVNGKITPTWTDVVNTVQKLHGPTSFVLRNDGTERTVSISVATVQGLVEGADPTAKPKIEPVGAIGVGPTQYFHYNAASALGGAGWFTGQMFANTWEGIKRVPEKVPAVIKAIGGAPRQADTPISVVGASRIGGEAVEQGLWPVFVLLLASLNFFFGVFNLLPLLPMDGGHIAVNLYQWIRDRVRRLRGQPDGAPVDYTKLSAVTMVVVLIGGAMVLLTVTADIVNPIKLGGQ